MIPILAFALTLHAGDEHPGGDRWFSTDKAKHFLMAGFVQSVSYSGLRLIGAQHGAALAGATLVSGGVSIGKEMHDQRSGQSVSTKDLIWDAAGIAATCALLAQTRR